MPGTVSADRYAQIVRARSLKAATLAAALQSGGFTADLAAHLTRDEQIAAENITGIRNRRDGSVRPPSSPETWRLVVGMLAQSRLDEALCPYCGQGDPQGAPGPRKPFGHRPPCSR